MSTFILSLNEHHPAPVNLDRLQMWSDWLSKNAISPTWITTTLDPTFGLERSIDILWLGIMLPQLSVQNPQTPTWMSNVEHLAGLYKQGIDLLAPQTIREMDVADLNALFPDLMIDHDIKIVQDLLLTYKAYIEMRKKDGHPAGDLQHSDWTDRWTNKWTQRFNEPPFHFYDLFPSITTLLNKSHRPTPYTPQHITPTAMQALWSSGVLDSAMDTESATDSMVEDLCNAAKVTVDRLHIDTNLSKGDIILRLHGFFETKRVSGRYILRPWLWGHSPCLVFSD